VAVVKFIVDDIFALNIVFLGKIFNSKILVKKAFILANLLLFPNFN